MTKQEAIEYALGMKEANTQEHFEMFIDIAIECIEKQIPKKVEWTLDYTWGVEKEVPVCPTCDYYLTPIEFIDANICERTGHCEFLKVSYCEHCSQAIDWSDNG